MGLLAALAACGPTSRPGGDRDADVPAACQSCPDDCCRLANDGGFACMNFDHRNPVTLECSCGLSAACDAFQTCCPPISDPAPLLPATCVTSAGQCDPRPSGMH